MKKAFAQINIAVLLWGFTGILGKAISLSAPVLVWWRMSVAAIIIFAIITFRKEWVPITKKDIFKLIGIGILFAIHWVAFYGSVKLANASIAMVCLATASIFTAVFDPLFNRRKINKREILLSLIAVIGVVCIYVLQPKIIDPEHQMVDFELGLLLGIFASVISAAFTIFNKPLSEKYPAKPLVFSEMASGLLFLTILAPFYIIYFPVERLMPVSYDWIWILILSYCCTVWAQSLAMAALKKLTAFTVTLSVNLEPVYGIILAFLIFKENAQLGYGFYIGMVLIFISLLLQVLATVRKAKKTKRILQDNFQ